MCPLAKEGLKSLWLFHCLKEVVRGSSPKGLEGGIGQEVDGQLADLTDFCKILNEIVILTESGSQHKAGPLYL